MSEDLSWGRLRMWCGIFKRRVAALYAVIEPHVLGLECKEVFRGKCKPGKLMGIEYVGFDDLAKKK